MMFLQNMQLQVIHKNHKSTLKHSNQIKINNINFYLQGKKEI